MCGSCNLLFVKMKFLYTVATRLNNGPNLISQHSRRSMTTKKTFDTRTTTIILNGDVNK